MFDWIRGVDAVMLAGLFFTFMWFVVDWCMSTTFRPMSYPQLYIVNFTVSLLLLAPWMLTRFRTVGLLVIFILDLILEANLVYCRTYFTAIPPGGYLMAGNMIDFTDSIWLNLRWSDLGFAVVFSITAILSVRFRHSGRRMPIKPYFVLTSVSVIISYVYILCLGGFYKAYDRIVQYWMTYTSGVPTYTVAGHLLFKIMEEKSLKKTDVDELKAVDDWIRKHKDRYAPVRCKETRTSIVFIICESLESWPIGLDIDGKEVTPFLNSLIGDSTTFFAPKVMTQVCNGHSIDGQLIYTTGLLPTTNTVYSMKYPDRNYPSLNKLLRKDRNAKSILMTTDKPVTWNMLAVANAFGYDTVLNRNNWIDDEMMNHNITDGSFLRQSLAELKKGTLWPENTPAMLTFITYSGHSPFVLKSELKDPEFDISKERLPKVIENFIEMTHYVDSQLKSVIEYVGSRSDSDSTMIVILGDHEGLAMKRADLLKSSVFVREKVGKGRYTPMIVVNSPVSGRYEGVIGQADVFPTILDMLGVRGDDWRGVGVSMMDSSRVDVAFSVIPPEMDGDAGMCSSEDLEHLRSAQSVSELIIIHDLYEQRNNLTP